MVAYVSVLTMAATTGRHIILAHTKCGQSFCLLHDAKPARRKIIIATRSAFFNTLYKHKVACLKEKRAETLKIQHLVKESSGFTDMRDLARELEQIEQRNASMLNRITFLVEEVLGWEGKLQKMREHKVRANVVAGRSEWRMLQQHNVIERNRAVHVLQLLTSGLEEDHYKVDTEVEDVWTILFNSVARS